MNEERGQKEEADEEKVAERSWQRREAGKEALSCCCASANVVQVMLAVYYLRYHLALPVLEGAFK